MNPTGQYSTLEQLVKELRLKKYHVHANMLASGMWNVDLMCGVDVRPNNEPRPRAMHVSLLEAVKRVAKGIVDVD